MILNHVLISENNSLIYILMFISLVAISYIFQLGLSLTYILPY